MTTLSMRRQPIGEATGMDVTTGPGTLPGTTDAMVGDGTTRSSSSPTISIMILGTMAGVVMITMATMAGGMDGMILGTTTIGDGIPGTMDITMDTTLVEAEARATTQAPSIAILVR